jgi:DNA-binding LacI/PurR family transcriptional regulator
MLEERVMISKDFLYTRIYNDLLAKIRGGVFSPNSRLPSEKELSEQYGVSRITSKNALEVLRKEGYVQRIPGRGTFVTESALTKISDGALQKCQKPADDSRRIIGLIIEDFSENFGLFIISGVERACGDLGFHLILKRSFGSQKLEATAIHELLELGVSGLIIMPVHGDTYNAIILKLAIENFPLVLLDRELAGVPASFVGTENVSAARDLAECLFQTACRHICFVGPAAKGTPTIAQRIIGFTKCNAAHGILVNDADLLLSFRSTLPGEKQDIEHDTQIIANYLRERPETDAFFVAEYNLALIVYKALTQMQKHVPEDCAIVCFDGPENCIGDYNFTHLHQDEELIGRACVELLVEATQGKPTRKVFVPSQIRKGKSTR